MIDGVVSSPVAPEKQALNNWGGGRRLGGGGCVWRRGMRVSRKERCANAIQVHVQSVALRRHG